MDTKDFTVLLVEDDLNDIFSSNELSKWRNW